MQPNPNFWRENSNYHKRRADFWMKVSRTLAGVLVGIAVGTFIALKMS